MNKLASEAKEFAVASRDLAKKAEANNIDLGVAPTYLSLATVKEELTTMKQTKSATLKSKP